MPQPIRLRDLLKALEAVGCKPVREGSKHTIWACPCGKHRFPVPRHTEISAGVVGSIQKQVACQEKGWLQ